MEDIILINEERGVAASRYKNAIDDIYNDIEKRIKLLSIYDKLQVGSNNVIHVPKYLTNKIDFIEDDSLDIIINVVVHKKEDNVDTSGGAFCTVYKGTKISENGLLGSGRIEINLHVNELGDIYKLTFYGNIYHELNHLYELYSQACHNEKNDIYSTKYASNDISRRKKRIVDYLKSHFDESDDIGRIIIGYVYDILYRLLSDTEMNSNVSTVYGDLKAMNSTRDKFNSDIKKTESYYIYKRVLDILDDINYIPPTYMEVIMNAFNDNGIHIGKDVKSFKRNLVKIIKDKVNKLRIGIGKAASLYYDNIEDSQKIVNEYALHNFGTFMIEGQLMHSDEPFCVQKMKKISDFLEKE